MENKYYESIDFQNHRTNICNILERIPFAQSPKHWVYKNNFPISGFECFGFSETSDILFVASSQGRSLIDMSKNKKIARDYSDDYTIDETLLTCDGFDVLEGQQIKLASKYGGSMLPISNKSYETLVKVSPLYPCEDLIFQSPYENCFIEKNNKNCIRIYRGFLYCYGFSFSGNYFVIADDGGISYWESKRTL